MNADDHKDFSIFQSFFDSDIKYFSNVTLDAAITEMIKERNARTPHEFDNGFMHDILNINDEFTKLFKELGINRRRTQ